MWFIGSCLNDYPIPRNSCCFCSNPSCYASIVLLPVCILPLAFLSGSNMFTCNRSSSSTASRAGGSVLWQGKCRGHAGHAENPGPATHLPCTGWLPEACTCHLWVHGVMALGTYSPSVRACTEHTGHAFHLPVGKVAACLRLPGIRHIDRAVVRPGEWPCSSLFTCAKFLGEKEEHVEEQPQRQLKCTDLWYIYTCCIQDGLSPRYINSLVPGGTAIQHRDPAAPLAAWLRCWEQPSCSRTKLNS